VNKILTIAGVQKIDAKNLGAAGAFDMMRKTDGELTNRYMALPNIPAGEKASYAERLESLNDIRNKYLEAGATLGHEVDRAGGLMFSLGIQIGTAKNVLGNNAAGMLELTAAAVAMGMSDGAKQSGAAQSAKQAANLSKHLGYIEKYGKGGVKELENGRIRYIGELQLSDKQGEMAGRRYVHEYNPASGQSRGWHETVDHNGRVRQVRPEMNDGNKTHYKFDGNGKYTGSW
jgi:hypothetical protein